MPLTMAFARTVIFSLLVGGHPETALYVNGRQYMTNCFNSNPTNGTAMAFLWELRSGLAVPVAAVGSVSAWEQLKDQMDPKNPQTFTWSDLNDDGQVQPDEVKIVKGRSGGVVVHPDLTILTSTGLRLSPQGFTAKGAPIYDITKAETSVQGTQNGLSSGGDQVMTSKSGWTILTVGPKPFGADSMAGIKDGKPMWSYPSLWPGLHASHNAAMPDHPGELLGTTRLLGGFVSPKGSDVGDLWAINGNMGNVYLFSADGLFVATLWKDGRTASWAIPVAQRGMSRGDVDVVLQREASTDDSHARGDGAGDVSERGAKTVDELGGFGVGAGHGKSAEFVAT